MYALVRDCLLFVRCVYDVVRVVYVCCRFVCDCVLCRACCVRCLRVLHVLCTIVYGVCTLFV